MMTSTMRKRVFADTLAVFLAIGAAAWAVSGLSADEGGKPSSDLPSAIEDTWTSDPESMLRQARGRLGIGDGSLPSFSPLAPNPVVPDGQVGEFRHGTWPSLGVGDGNWTHAGVDLTAPCGSRILAFADGTVVDRIAGDGEPGFDALGHMVLIEHPEALLGRGFRTLYVHLQEPPRVAVGDKVEGGRTVIGRVGATGAALGCHLHFEARFFPGRFHPDWDNIYGRGDRRSGDELQHDWIDPELLFRAFPEGLSAPAAVATRSQAGSLATTTAAARESSGPAVDSGASAGDLILALEELDRAINAKIDRDLDTIAFAYWSSFDVERARRFADWIMAPVEVIKTALDIHLFTEGLGEIQTRIKRAKSTLELAALTTGFVQAHQGVRTLLLDGQKVSDAIDIMIQRASTHPRDAQAFQGEIRRYLEDGAASPIALAAPDDPGSGESAEHPIRGVSEVGRALAAELSRLKADLAAAPPDPAAAERAARSVRELTQAFKRSAVARQEVPLTGTAGATAPTALSLGAVAELNRAWTDALGNYDRDMRIEQVVNVVSITNLGISYLTISTSPLDAAGAAIRSAKTVATALDLGSLAFEHTFTTNAREQVNTLPHEMVLTLAPELANLWRLVRGVESTVRGQREAERSAEPALVAAAPEATAGASADAGGDQVEITLGDGSVLKGHLGAAKVPFASGYGTIEVETSAISSFADGRLALEDGSVLKGAFGAGEVSLTTGQGTLRLPTREIVAISRSGISEAAARDARAPAASTPRLSSTATGDELTKAEAEALIRATVDWTRTAWVEVLGTKLWKSGVAWKLTEEDKCWPATAELYNKAPMNGELDLIGQPRPPYLRTNLMSTGFGCRSRTGCVEVSEKGLQNNCNSFLAGAQLVQAPNFRFYPSRLEVITHRADGAVTSLLTRNGEAEVTYRVSWKPLKYLESLRAIEPALSVQETAPVSALRSQVHVVLRQYDQGWKIVGQF